MRDCLVTFSLADLPLVIRETQKYKRGSHLH